MNSESENRENEDGGTESGIRETEGNTDEEEEENEEKLLEQQ